METAYYILKGTVWGFRTFGWVLAVLGAISLLYHLTQIGVHINDIVDIGLGLSCYYTSSFAYKSMGDIDG